MNSIDQKLLENWNNTRADYPHQCLHQLVESQVERTPDSIAVSFENSSLTYRKLNNRANQLARYLQSLGVEPDALVGICVERIARHGGCIARDSQSWWSLCAS